MTTRSTKPASVAMRTVSGLHRGLYRLTGGRIGGRFGKMPMVLLTTTGRKTGQPRTTPLTYLPDSGNYVLIGSNGGKDWPPAWLGNLEAHPDASIQIGKKVVPVTATIATPEQ